MTNINDDAVSEMIGSIYGAAYSARGSLPVVEKTVVRQQSQLVALLKNTPLIRR